MTTFLTLSIPVGNATMKVFSIFLTMLIIVALLQSVLCPSCWNKVFHCHNILSNPHPVPDHLLIPVKPNTTLVPSSIVCHANVVHPLCPGCDSQTPLHATHVALADANPTEFSCEKPPHAGEPLKDRSHANLRLQCTLCSNLVLTTTLCKDRSHSDKTKRFPTPPSL